MISEKNLAEYRALHAVLGHLRQQLVSKRQKVIGLMEETAIQQKKTLARLRKTNRQNRYLTCRQRELAKITYTVNIIPLVVNARANLPETRVPEIKVDCQSLRELKQQELLILAMIDEIKKRLLQLEILENRCGEMILSMKKAMEAFNLESGIIRRKLFPLWVFSFLYRYGRRLFGKTYFTFRDLENIAALGELTSLVLKIANSPLV